jgi:hypothetical protein
MQPEKGSYTQRSSGDSLTKQFRFSRLQTTGEPWIAFSTVNSTLKTATLWTPQPEAYPTENLSIPGHTENYALNLSILYQDEQMRRWAQEVHGFAGRIVGSHSVAVTWWNIPALDEPTVLAGAVAAAMHTDLLVIAVQADVDLRLSFYRWADAWISHRSQKSGALLALLALPEQVPTKLYQRRAFLQSLARRGGLEFMGDERVFAFPRTSAQMDLESGDTVARAVLGTMAYKDDRFACWRRATRMAG